MPTRFLSNIDAIKPVLAMLGAAVSYVGGLVGKAQLPEIGWWFESGGMLALVGCLIYGLIALWRARGEERRVMLEQIEAERKEAKAEREDLVHRLQEKDGQLEALNKEVRERTRQQNADLLEAINRLNRSIENR